MTIKLKTSLGVLIFLLTIPFSQAESFTTHGMKVTVEPVVGYNFLHSNTPSPHTNLILIYGARATVGNGFLAGEGEYTQGSNREVFPLQGQTITTTIDQARLGLRTTHHLVGFLNVITRAGGQASRQKVETFQNNITTVSQGKWIYRPYLGAGLEGVLGKMLSLTADASYVFNSTSDWSQNDVQATASLKFNFNTK